MAIGTIPPWVRGPDTLGALSSGASAGATAGRMESENRNESARLGLESLRLRQGAAMETARLNQAAEQSQMEFQARQKLAEQNQLRESQRLNIENAYKTAQLGIAQGRLEQTQKAADEKAKAAALAFQDEQGFAQHLRNGGSVLEGIQKFPRISSSYLNSIERTQIKEGQNKPIIREGKFPLIEYDPSTRKTTTLYTPPKPEGLSVADKEDLKDLRSQRKDVYSRIGGYLVPPEQKAALTTQLSEIDKRIEAIKHPAPKMPTAEVSSKDKLVRAHALGIAHPDWTKEQIIDAVNKEMP